MANSLGNPAVCSNVGVLLHMGTACDRHPCRNVHGRYAACLSWFLHCACKECSLVSIGTTGIPGKNTVRDKWEYMFLLASYQFKIYIVYSASTPVDNFSFLMCPSAFGMGNTRSATVVGKQHRRALASGCCAIEFLYARSFACHCMFSGVPSTNSSVHVNSKYKRAETGLYEYTAIWIQKVFFFLMQRLCSPQPCRSCAACTEPSALVEMLALQLLLKVALFSLRAFLEKFAAYAPILNMAHTFCLKRIKTDSSTLKTYLKIKL